MMMEGRRSLLERWRFQVGLVVVVMGVLVFLSGWAEGSVFEGNGGDEELRIESVVGRSRLWSYWNGVLAKAADECEEHYGFMPCSTSLGGNAALLVIYGFMLLKAAQLLSNGSELLLTVMHPGIIGGLVLPILGAFPDALLIAVSGLGASQAEAQSEVLVGMGLVAGSSVMLLTALWGSCLIVGRCDLEANDSGTLVAKSRTLTKGFHLTETGVTTDQQTRWASWIMMATLLPFVVAQIPSLFGLQTGGHLCIALAAAISVAGLITYCVYQIVVPWIQERKRFVALHRYRTHALNRLSHHTKEKGCGDLFSSEDGSLDQTTLDSLFDLYDQNNDGDLTWDELHYMILTLGIELNNGKVPLKAEVDHWMKEFDTSKDTHISHQEFLEGISRWMKSATNRKGSGSSAASPYALVDAEAPQAKCDFNSLLDYDDNDEDSDNDREGNPPTRKQIIWKAVGLLIAGAAVAAIFADPLVDAIGGFSKASGIPPFFISFIATPLATNSSEAISSILFARRKHKKNISMTYSQIYGAVTMNNTMCLGIFLAIVYFRGLLWDFSAEVSVIIFATLIMGGVAAVRTTFPLWMAFIGLALYPASIGLVAFLDYVCGWH